MDPLKPSEAGPDELGQPERLVADEFPVADEWSAACLRLEDYLRAHRVQDRHALLRLTLRIIDEAKRLHAGEPLRSPVAVTMEFAVNLTEAWFARLAGGDFAPADPMLVARGRVAYFATGAYRKWPQSFLDPHPAEELIAAVQDATLQAGPDLEFTSLIRREIEYGPMEEIARETWEKFSWRYVLRAFAVWIVIFFAAYFSYLRFLQ